MFLSTFIINFQRKGNYHFGIPYRGTPWIVLFHTPCMPRLLCGRWSSAGVYLWIYALMHLFMPWGGGERPRTVLWRDESYEDGANRRIYISNFCGLTPEMAGRANFQNYIPLDRGPPFHSDLFPPPLGGERPTNPRQLTSSIRKLAPRPSATLTVNNYLRANRVAANEIPRLPTTENYPSILPSNTT